MWLSHNSLWCLINGQNGYDDTQNVATLNGKLSDYGPGGRFNVKFIIMDTYDTLSRTIEFSRVHAFVTVKKNSLLKIKHFQFLSSSSGLILIIFKKKLVFFSRG